jgi:hypothetical protein
MFRSVDDPRRLPEQGQIAFAVKRKWVRRRAVAGITELCSGLFCERFPSQRARGAERLKAMLDRQCMGAIGTVVEALPNTKDGII